MTPSHRLVRLRWCGLFLAAAACGGAPRPTPEAGSPGAIERAAGAPRVRLSDSAVALAGIRTEPARDARQDADAAALAVPAEVAADPARIALITPRAAGRLERLQAAVGAQVRAGAVVAEVLTPDLLVAETDYQLARRRAERLRGTPDSAGAWALVEAAAQRLDLLGAGAAERRRLDAGGDPTALVALTAPFAGSLVDGGALPGARVEPGTQVFRLVDLSEVDVVARVPESAIASVRIGQRARVTLEAFPDRTLVGVIERIRDELDPTTRTIEAVLHLGNPGGALRPAMFATVLLQGAGLRPGDVLVPGSALVTDGEGQAAFVEVRPGIFERRDVVAVALPPLPGAVAPLVLIRQGLTAGERVVVNGAFVLKSELGKAAFAEEE
jgi:RND family efflux transporter MFP subunit